MIATPNLATRPLRNERLPVVLLGLALAGLLALTVKHALVLRQLLPSRTAAVEGEVRALEQELAALQAQGHSLPRAKPEPRVLAEWQAVRELVDKRSLSWTRLLARLEAVMPPGVKLASIAPNVKDGRITLEMAAVGRTTADGYGFLRVLQATEDFDEVVPSSVGEGSAGDGEIRYTMRYTPAAWAPGRPEVPLSAAVDRGVDK